MNIFRQFYAYLHLRHAVAAADKAHSKYNRRFYVLPGDKGTLVISDRKNFRILRRKHWIRGAANATMDDVAARAFYYTAHSGGRNAMPEQDRKRKVLEYYRWYSKSRK